MGSPKERTFGPAGRKRRAQLMETAVRLAARNGFGRTRVSDIVGHLGVGQGVFYWYFESKDAMFREILGDTTERLRRFQGAYIAEEGDPIVRIARGILATFEFIVHNRYAFALLDHAAAQARFQRTRTEAGRVHSDDILRHLRDAMDAGIVRETEPQYLSEAVRGVVDRLARVFLARKAVPPDEVDRVAQEAIDFCVGGLAGDRRVLVSDLRERIELTPELLEIRDHVGTGAAHPDGS